LTPDDVRLLTLQAQGMIGAQARRGGVPAMLHRIGAVQLDTISVLARSHELVAYARLGAIGRTAVERAYWGPRTPVAFEYWAHAACVLPMQEWPYYGFRRRAFLARGKRWHDNHPGIAAEVLARLRAEGPLTATQLGGAKKGGVWWDWSDTKIAVEWLLDTGEAVCTRRIGWRRVYDLPDRVLSPDLLKADPSDADCLIHLAAVTARALGVATRSDLSDYQRISNFGSGANSAGLSADAAAAAAGLIPVQISAGRAQPPIRAWADPVTIAGLSSADDESPSGASPEGASPEGASPDGENLDGYRPDRGRPAGERRAGGRRRSGRHRVTLLSPFDSLVWDRKRALRMFAFKHSLEAYVPQPKRVHGYYSMPLLASGRLMGRVDPARDGRTLIAKQVTLDTPKAAEPMARALAEAASWVGCDSVHLGIVNPPELAPRLRSALTQEGT
jgi:uncharacterized protein YcaQ